MALSLKQQLKLTQQLVMTPQLQQAIKLLQLSRMELVEAINQELLSNPVLEENQGEEEIRQEQGGGLQTEVGERPEGGEELPTLASSELEKTPWESSALKEAEWREYWDDDGRSTIHAYSFEAKEQVNYENIVRSTTDLLDHLLWQLQMDSGDEQERQIGQLIIGNIDESGYLKASVEEIAEDAGVEPEKVEKVLRRIQRFDPVGVAARDLKECLLIQIDHYAVGDPLAKEIVEHHLDKLERHNYQAIAKATGSTVAEVARAVEVIQGLEPRPGRSFSSEETHYIVPDIYVYKVGDEYVISLNDDGMPKLRISSFYRDAVNDNGQPKDAKAFLQEKLKSAMWFIKSIQQRQKTIYRVTESIVKFQREFLDKGIAYLKPLILKDVAEDVGLHESTVSRVTTNKYVHTPQGVFELKFFFSAGLKKGDGEDIATQSVKERIRQLIQSENPEKPYSDEQIVKLLAKDNIKIARRTVAKYRNMMGILPSSRRKRPSVG